MDIVFFRDNVCSTFTEINGTNFEYNVPLIDLYAIFMLLTNLLEGCI